MKITIKLPKPPKPRNPLALAARQRKAGSHQSDKPSRQIRRNGKNDLRLYLLGRKDDLQ
jgi:hypothetical protein